MSSQKRIAIIQYPGALKSAVFGMEEILRFAGAFSKERPLEVTICEEAFLGFDAYVLPPAAEPLDVAGGASLIQRLKEAHEKGALLCSVCAGLIWIAETGVIGNRHITTHWALDAHIKESYPDLLPDVNQILVEHADLITAGGMMAWVDLCLSLIERLIGRDALIETSRHFVIELNRPDQSRFRSFRPDLTHQDAAIRKVQLAIESHFAHHQTLQDMAEIAGLSERTFARRFAKVTKTSPSKYVQLVRIEKAKDMLIHSTRGVQEIAFDVGYADLSSFGRKFFQVTTMTPKEFRNTYRRDAKPQ